MRKYLIAEYCAGPFYMGWWMYERDTNDGEPNTTTPYDAWGWLRGEYARDDAYALCVAMGDKPPPVERWSQKFNEWFAATYPAGLLIETDGYRLIEKVATMPKQKRRCVIRTVARSDRSFARARAIEAARQERERT